MGCINSTLKSDEVVYRCRARKRFMKQAVLHRQAFAVAHNAYLQALRNTGAALRQFAEGETGDASALKDSATQVLSLPEPPLPPSLLISSSGAVRRSSNFSSRPETDGLAPSDGRPMSPSKKDESWTLVTSKVNDPPPPPSPPRNMTWEFLNPFRAALQPFLLQEQRKTKRSQEDEELRRLKEIYGYENIPDLEEENGIHYAGLQEKEGLENALVRWQQNKRELALVARLGGGKDLLEVVKELDEQFLKASSGGTEISRFLEMRNSDASHSESNCSNSVFSALSFNWSRAPVASKDGMDNNLRTEETEKTGNHALTLQRLYAWEKKLFAEVKAGEALRADHQKKCVLLKQQEVRGEDTHTMDKTRAQIKRLHSRILVSFQGVDSTNSAIQSVRDDELYLQLVDFVEGLMAMWRMMHLCHAHQKQIVFQIKKVDSSDTPEATSEFHHNATVQLERELNNWNDCLCKLVNSHRDYMTAINGWLKLSLIQIETEEGAEDTLDSPRKPRTPKICYLCEEWQRALDRQPDKVASEAIKSLAAVVHALVQQQTLEIRQKRKAENLAKQLEKKVHSLQSIERKLLEAPPPSPPTPTAVPRVEEEEDINAEEEEYVEEGTETYIVAAPPTKKDPLAEKRASMDSFKKKVEEEREKHSRSIQDTRCLTMNNLQTGLPGVFEAMIGFSAVCAQAFEGLCNQTRNVKADQPWEY